MSRPSLVVQARRRRPRRAITFAPRSCSSQAATPPTLPKPWTTQRCPARSQPSRGAGALDHHHDAGAGRLRPEDRAADRDRLAGDDLRDGVADLHRVRVHHPGHRLLVGRHVGRRDVLLRADHRQELGGEAARDRLELAARTARAGRSGSRPSRRRRAAAAARTSRSSTSRAPRTRRARRAGRSGCRPSSGRARSSAGRGSPGRPSRRPSSSLTGTATISERSGTQSRSAIASLISA